MGVNRRYFEDVDWSSFDPLKASAYPESVRKLFHLIMINPYAQPSMKGERKTSYTLDGDWTENTDSRSGWWSTPYHMENTNRVGFFGGMRGVTSGSNWVWSASGEAPFDATRGDIMVPYNTTDVNLPWPSYVVEPTVLNGLTRATQVWGPGSCVVWYEEKWSYTFTSVSATGVFKFTKSAATVGHFRDGTPFRVTGTSNVELDRVWRVQSTTTDASYIYVQAEDPNGDIPALSAAFTVSGTAACNFGGAYYALNKWVAPSFFKYSSSNSADWKYDAKRPPAGGDQSAHSNSNWSRIPNPHHYHHYDVNAGTTQFWCNYQTDATDTWVQHSAAFPAYLLLPVQVDPVEIHDPVKYDDTDRTSWQYKHKVAVRANQITNPAMLGPQWDVQGVAYQISGGTTQTLVESEQYWKVVFQEQPSGLVSDYRTQYPNHASVTPEISPASNTDCVFDEKKLADIAYQTMAELAVATSGWVYPVINDHDYIWNWLKEHWTATCTHDDKSPQRTYGAVFESDGTDGYIFGFAAYNPTENSEQPEYSYLNDWRWACNESAIELLLKIKGEYDWFYDTATPYTPETVLTKRVLDAAVEPTAAPDTPGNAYYNPKPPGTWRRTWKNSMGRVRDWQMLDKEQEAGIAATYATYPGYADWPQVYNAGSPHSTYTATAPSKSFFASATGGTWSVTGGTHTVTLSTAVNVGDTLWDADGNSHTVLRKDGTSITFTEVLPAGSLTLYHNANISARHDGMIVSGDATVTNTFYQNIFDTLAEIRQVLHMLVYRAEPISGQHRTYQAGQDFVSSGVQGATPTACIEAFYAWCLNQFPDTNPLDYVATDEIRVGCEVHYAYTYGYYEPIVGSPNAYGFKGMYVSDGNHLLPPGSYIRLRLAMTAGAVWPVYDYDPVIAGTVNPLVRIDNSTTYALPIGADHKTVYKWVYADIHDGSKFIFDSANPPEVIPTTLTSYGTDDHLLLNAAKITVTPQGGNGIMYVYNWDGYDEAIWERDTIHAEVMPEDYTTDTKPPVDSPPQWWEEPYLYDANIETGRLKYVDPYALGSAYVPEWRLRWVIHPTYDLGSPPVQYWTDDATSDAPATYVETWQSSNVFEYVIGTKSDVDTLVSTYNLDTWSLRAKVKDAQANTSAYSTAKTVDMTDFDEAY